ncbi:hypothetical protein FDB61_15915 [Clostridium botulinum]|nr:hypothetical protein [Clostridium botulinum]
MSKLIRRVALALSIATLGAMIPGSSHAAEQPHWKENNNSWYYIDSVGKATTGWLQDGANWYYMWSDGTMAKDTWIQSANGNWYYLGSNGAMLCNTTIGNYTLGASGAWEVSGTSAFTWQDAQGEHVFRIDISPRPDDDIAKNILTNYNMQLSEEDKYNLSTLTYNISKETLYLSEAKAQCIGKTIGNKVITDIKFYKEVFKNTQGISSTNRVNTIKSSNLYSYKSTSPYVYDEFWVFSGINDRNNEWECMRIMVELR